MKTLQEKVLAIRALLKGAEIPEEQIETIIRTIRREYPITLLAREAYDHGFPEHEGPVWFGRERWKTDFWKRQWRLWKAYREGESARTSLQSRDSNPYHVETKKLSMREIELEATWILGFKGEEF